MLLAPVDPRFAGRVLAGVALGEPLRAWEHVAGPEVRRAGDLARIWKAATGAHAVVVPLPLPRRFHAPLAAGALVPPDAVGGGPAFGEWLEERAVQTAGPAGALAAA
jgi:hypothetical protein